MNRDGFLVEDQTRENTEIVRRMRSERGLVKPQATAYFGTVFFCGESDSDQP